MTDISVCHSVRLKFNPNRRIPVMNVKVPNLQLISPLISTSRNPCSYAQRPQPRVDILIGLLVETGDWRSMIVRR